MTRKLSSSTRSPTEDSIFLRPDEDPVWLDEPTKIEKTLDGFPNKDESSTCKDGSQNSEGEEVFLHKVYALAIEIHCWAALFVVSQVTVCHQISVKTTMLLNCLSAMSVVITL